MGPSNLSGASGIPSLSNRSIKLSMLRAHSDELAGSTVKKSSR